MTCPHCHNQLSDGASGCARCGAVPDEVAVAGYHPGLARLKSALSGISRGETPLAQTDGLFASLMGAVQSILDQASEDLQQGYRELHRQRGEEDRAGRPVAEFVEDFGELQDDLHLSVRQIGELFGQCRTLHDFQLYLPIVEGHVTSIQASIDGLDRLCRQSSSAALAKYPGEPLEPEVSRAIEHYDAAVKALLVYMDGPREVGRIEECLRFTDQAGEQLRRLLRARGVTGDAS